MGLRYEAWTTPWDSAGFKRKVAKIHEIEGTGRGSVPFLTTGGSPSVEISTAKTDRLSEIVSDTETSLMSVYDCLPDGTNTLIDEWVVERSPREMGEDKRVPLSGWRLKSVFDRFLVYPYDYPKNPAIQKDWKWGSEPNGGLLRNGGFETTLYPNGGFEEGDDSHWQGTQTDDFLNAGSLSVTNDPANAFEGDWYGIVRPGAPDSGIRRSYSGLIPGQQYTITMRIQDDDLGARIRAGISDAKSASHTNAYEEHGYRWAEIGNATQGNGSSDGTWQLTTLTWVASTENAELLITYAGGTASLDFWVDAVGLTGPLGEIDGWQPRADGRWPTSPQLDSLTNIFDISTTTVHSGLQSLRWQVYDTLYTNPYNPDSSGFGMNGPVSDPVPLTVGKTYTGEVWVRQDSGSSAFYIFVIRRTSIKGQIGTPGSVYMWSQKKEVPSGVWTQFKGTFVADAPEVTFEIRWQYQGAEDTAAHLSPITFTDSAQLDEGLPATTIGDIWQTLLTDASVNHPNDARGLVLDWIDFSSFDDANDSNGIPWNETIPFLATFGSHLGHVIDDTVERGYEWDLVRKTTPSGGKTHDFLLYNPGGRDDSPSTGISPRQSVVGGSALSRTPRYTAALVASPNGSYAEAKDATTEANFGRLETFISDTEASDSTTRQLLADNFFTYEQANRHAVTFNIIEFFVHARPLVKYRPGDTVPMQQPPGLAKESRRVQNIDYANTFPTSYVVTGSRVIKGEAAAYDLIWRMWRRLQRPKRDIPKPVLGRGTGEGGLATPTIYIACSDATSESIANAHIIATGSDDAQAWEAALNLANQFAQPTAGVRIVVSEGKLFVSPSNPIRVTDNIHLQGLGMFRTQVVNDGDGALGQHLVEVQTDGELSDIGFNTTSSYLGRAVLEGYGRLSNIWHQGAAEAAIWITGSQHPIDNLQISGHYTDAGIVVDEGWTAINNLVALRSATGGGGPTIRFSNRTAQVSTLSNVVISNGVTGVGDGIVIDGGQIVITGAAIRTPGNAAIAINDEAPFQLTVDSCFLSGDYGVEFKGAFPSMDSTVFSNCNIVAAITALKMNFVFRSIFTDCYMEGQGEHVIEFVDSGDIRLTDCLIRSRNLDLANTYDIIRLVNTNRAVIMDNQLLAGSTPRYGISIDAASNDNIVVGNSYGQVTDYGTDPFNDLGANTRTTYPNHAKYGDNFVLGDPGFIVKVEGETIETTEGDISVVTPTIIKVEGETVETSEGDIKIVTAI